MPAVVYARLVEAGYLTVSDLVRFSVETKDARKALVRLVESSNVGIAIDAAEAIRMLRLKPDKYGFT